MLKKGRAPTLSKSSPPKCVSPEVDSTSNTPSPTSSTEIETITNQPICLNTQNTNPSKERRRRGATSNTWDIKSTTTKVKHQDCFVVFPFKAIRQWCRSWFIYDSKNLQTGNPAGILCGSPLRIIEVRGHSHHSLGHFIIQKLRSVINKLPQHLYMYICIR